RITRPLASRECWYSPRNIWLPRLPVVAPRTADHSPVLHFAPPYAPTPHWSTPLAPTSPPGGQASCRPHTARRVRTGGGRQRREWTPAALKKSEDAATTALPTAVAGAEAREGDRSGDDAFPVGEVGLPEGVDGPDGGDQPEGCVRRAGTA